MRFPLLPIPSGSWCVWGRQSGFPRRETAQHCVCSPVPIPGGMSPAVPAPWWGWLVQHHNTSSSDILPWHHLSAALETSWAWKSEGKGHRAVAVPNPPRLSEGSASILVQIPALGQRCMWGCWEKTLWLATCFQRAEEEEKPKSSMGQAALAASRAIGVCHLSPSPETPVWILWWYHWDMLVPSW